MIVVSEIHCKHTFFLFISYVTVHGIKKSITRIIEDTDDHHKYRLKKK